MLMDTFETILRHLRAIRSIAENLPDSSERTQILAEQQYAFNSTLRVRERVLEQAKDLRGNNYS